MYSIKQTTVRKTDQVFDMQVLLTLLKYLDRLQGPTTTITTTQQADNIVFQSRE